MPLNSLVTGIVLFSCQNTKQSIIMAFYTHWQPHRIGPNDRGKILCKNKEDGTNMEMLNKQLTFPKIDLL